MFEAHRDWARRHADPLRPSSAPPRRRIPPGMKLRVGFISPALRWGPGGIFALPLLENLDATRFEIHCYHVGGRSDTITERIRARASVWHELAAADDATIAARIRVRSPDNPVRCAGPS